MLNKRQIIISHDLVGHSAKAMLIVWLSVCPLAIAQTNQPLTDPKSSAINRPESDQLTARQQRDLDLLLNVLDNDKMDQTQRIDATLSLIDRAWPAAMTALQEKLVKPKHAATPRLIAMAIAKSDQPPAQLASTMISLLTDKEPENLTAFGQALGRYHGQVVINQLIKLAHDPKAKQDRRIGAITALAEHYQAKSIDALIQLVDYLHPKPIREAAMKNLQRLTGIIAFNGNGPAWKQWWSQVRNLPPERWLTGVIQSLSRRKTELETQNKLLSDKLVEAYKRLYATTDQKQRPALLNELVAQDTKELRLLGLELVERMVFNGEKVAQELYPAIRKELDDTEPTVRAKAAQLLRHLADEPAADLVVKKLLAETDPKVQDAYLSLLSRLPRRQAVDGALILAKREATAESAAAFLVQAIDLKLLNETQLTRATTIARQSLGQKELPAVAMVRLLARIADAADRDLLVSYLAPTAPEAVRLEAAAPFVAGRYTPDPLYAYLTDKALAPKVIDAIAANGKTVKMVELLLQNIPEPADLQQAWTAAIVAVAKRLNMTDLTKADQALVKAKADDALRVAVLSAAIAPIAPPSDNQDIARQLTLIYSLAQLQMKLNEPAKALPLFDRLAQAKELNEALTAQVQAGRIAARLASDDIAGAMTLAKQWMTTNPKAQTASLAILILDTIERLLNEKKADQAAALLAQTQHLFGATLQGQVAKRMQSLQNKLTQLQKPASDKSLSKTPDS